MPKRSRISVKRLPGGLSQGFYADGWILKAEDKIKKDPELIPEILKC